VTDQIHYVFRRHYRRGAGSNAQWFKKHKIGLNYDFTNFFKTTFNLSIPGTYMHELHIPNLSKCYRHSIISKFDYQPISIKKLIYFWRVFDIWSNSSAAHLRRAA
jgi:hypothetical protein